MLLGLLFMSACIESSNARLSTALSPLHVGPTCEALTTLRSVHGWFRSGGEAYAPNSDCLWHIKPPLETLDPLVPQSTSVTFNYIDVEEGYDFVEVYDGSAVDEAQLLKRWTGRIDTAVYTSTDSPHGLLVRLVSDGWTQGKGFQAYYHEERAECEEDVLLKYRPFDSHAAVAATRAAPESPDPDAPGLSFRCAWTVFLRPQEHPSVWARITLLDLAVNEVVEVYDGGSGGNETSSEFSLAYTFGPGDRVEDIPQLKMKMNAMQIVYRAVSDFNGTWTPGQRRRGVEFSWEGRKCPDCQNGGTCEAGECVCSDPTAWKGELCDVRKRRFHCDAKRYNASDGCDCSCNFGDPDCAKVPDAKPWGLCGKNDRSYDRSVCAYCPVGRQLFFEDNLELASFNGLWEPWEPYVPPPYVDPLEGQRMGFGRGYDPYVRLGLDPDGLVADVPPTPCAFPYRFAPKPFFSVVTVTDCHRGVVADQTPVWRDLDWCFMDDKLATRAPCMSPKPCGMFNASRFYYDADGFIDDTYDLYPQLVSCTFDIQPQIHRAFTPYMAINITFEDFQVGTGNQSSMWLSDQEGLAIWSENSTVGELQRQWRTYYDMTVHGDPGTIQVKAPSAQVVFDGLEGGVARGFNISYKTDFRLPVGPICDPLNGTINVTGDLGVLPLARPAADWYPDLGGDQCMWTIHGDPVDGYEYNTIEAEFGVLDLDASSSVSFYDGVSDTAPLIVTITADDAWRAHNLTISASGTEMRIVFDAGNGAVGEDARRGWVLAWAVVGCDPAETCSGNGVCSFGGRCVCDFGWAGVACDQSYWCNGFEELNNQWGRVISHSNETRDEIWGSVSRRQLVPRTPESTAPPFLPVGLSCQWRVGFMSSFLDLDFLQFTLNGENDRVLIYEGWSPTNGILIANMSVTNYPTESLRVRNTTSLYIDLTTASPVNDGLGIDIQYTARRQIFVAPWGRDTAMPSATDPVANIQQALPLALNSSRIVLYPGRYEGADNCNLTFNGTKDVELTSTSGWQYTIVDCTGTGLEGIVATAGVNLIVEGVQVQGATTSVRVDDAATLTLKGSYLLKGIRGIYASGLGTKLHIENSYVDGHRTQRRPAFWFRDRVVVDGSGLHVLYNHATRDVVAQVDSSSIVSISASTFQGNLAGAGSVLAVLGESSLEMHATRFLDNSVEFQGSLIWLDGTILRGVELSIVDTRALACILAHGARIELTTFRVESSPRLELYGSNTTAADSIFARSSTTDGTGSTMLISSGIARFSESVFRGHHSTDGALAVLDGANVEVLGSLAYENTASHRGGWAFVKSAVLNTTDTAVWGNHAEIGGSIYAEDAELFCASFSAESCTADESGGVVRGVRSVVDISDAVTASNYAGSHALYESIHVAEPVRRRMASLESSWSSDLPASDAATGGVVSISGGEVFVKGLTTVNSSATIGGVLFAEGGARGTVSGLVGESSVAESGGVVAIQTGADILLRESSSTDSHALQHGGFLLQTSLAVLAAVDVVVARSTAAEAGGAFYIFNGLQGPERLLNVSVLDCDANNTGGGFEIHRSSVSGSQIRIERCTASRGAGLWMIDAQLHLEHSSVSNNWAAASGGGAHAVRSIATTADTVFQANEARLDGGGIFAYESEVVLEDSALSLNAAAIGGGAHCVFARWTAVDSDLRSNYAAVGAGAYFRDSQVEGDGLTAELNTAAVSGGGLLLAESSELTMRGSLLMDNVAILGYGGGLACMGCLHATITETAFRNNAADDGLDWEDAGDEAWFWHTVTQRFGDRYGNSLLGSELWEISPLLSGAPQLRTVRPLSPRAPLGTESARNKGGGALFVRPGGEITLSSSVFTGNSAGPYGHGGGLFVEDASVAMTGCSFESNAAGFGGGVFDRGPWRLRFNGTKLRIHSAEFLNNEAVGGGGGLFWYHTEPWGFENVTFSGNDAGFGPDLASPERGLLVQRWNNGTQAAGEVFSEPVKVDHVDYYGQTVTTLTGARVWATNGSADLFVFGETETYSVNGVATFTGMGVLQRPGTKDFRVRYWSSNVANFTITPISVHICPRGSINPFEADGKVGFRCNKCPERSYSLDTDDQECIKCPLNAICLGGDHILPMNGFWRSSNDSIGAASDELERTFMIPCPRPESCLGGPFEFAATRKASRTEVLQSSEGCEHGYRGNLCQMCGPGFGRTRRYDCKPCPGGLNLFLITLGKVAAIIVSVLFVMKSAVVAMYDNEHRLFALCKVAITYFQITSLIAMINAEWPFAVYGFLNGLDLTFSFGFQALDWDCLAGPSDSSGLSIILVKLCFFALLPGLSILLPGSYFYGFYRKIMWRIGSMKVLNGVGTRVATADAGTVVEGGRIPEARLPNIVRALKIRIDVEELELDPKRHGPHSLHGTDKAVMFYAIHVRRALRTATAVHIKRLMSRCFMAMMYVAYPNIFRVVLLSLRCRKLDTRDSFISEDPNLVCWDLTHWLWVSLVTLPTMAAFIIYVPLRAWRTLYVHRWKMRLDTPGVQRAWGFLFNDYQRKFLFWEGYVTAKKLLVVAVVVLFDTEPPVVLCAIVAAIVAIDGMVNYVFHPYRHEDIYMLQQCSTLASLLLTLSGAFFVAKHDPGADRPPDEDIGVYFFFKGSLSDALRIARLVFVFIVNGAFIFVWLRMSWAVSAKAVKHWWHNWKVEHNIEEEVDYWDSDEEEDKLPPIRPGSLVSQKSLARIYRTKTAKSMRRGKVSLLTKSMRSFRAVASMVRKPELHDSDSDADLRFEDHTKVEPLAGGDEVRDAKDDSDSSDDAKADRFSQITGEDEQEHKEGSDADAYSLATPEYHYPSDMSSLHSSDDEETQQRKRDAMLPPAPNYAVMDDELLARYRKKFRYKLEQRTYAWLKRFCQDKGVDFDLGDIPRTLDRITLLVVRRPGQED